ncbi:FxLYD domain-containing protein [Bordetella genomosp. 12]|uniref:Uncharacterized protein n=1 Tax=Bordetella genomosp. 12 TaxID=463035 RepID=A0A261VCX2_9BORD|nr:FxLYD domain-containing protein [Bordetella genomosp. 12]OZI71949.1 hypothetical protein CAL22_19400 [Bordetella genomosp. 12]
MPRFTHLSAAALLGLAAQAWSQTLPYGVTLGNLQASRDTQAGQTVITGTYGNQGQTRIEQASVTFALFDANGHEIGRISAQSTAPLLPGEVWHFHASSPLDFQRFSAVQAGAQ